MKSKLQSKEAWDWKIIEEIKADKPNAIAMGPFGSNITRDNFVSQGVPVIRGTNLIDNKFNEQNFVFLTEEKADQLKSSNAFPEDIVLTHRGTLGQVAIIPKDSKFKRYVVSQSQMKVSCDPEKALPLYVYYFLCSYEGQTLLLSHTSTTGVPALARPLTALKSIKIPIPSPEEQKRIVDILENLDQKLGSIKKQNALLEKTIQTIFKSWFIDFEFPNEEGEPYKSSGGEMVFNEELGKEVPKIWEVNNLGNLTEKFTTGLNPRKNFVLGNGKNFYVTIKNMYNRRVILDEKCDKINDEAIRKINSRSNLKIDDILFSGIGTIGRTYYVDENPKNWNISESIFTLRANKEKITPTILYNLLLSSNFQSYSKQLASGSVQKGIRMADLKNYTIPLPKIENQEKLSKIFKIILKQFKLNIKQIESLSQIQNYLLPKLMSGEINI